MLFVARQFNGATVSGLTSRTETECQAETRWKTIRFSIFYREN